MPLPTRDVIGLMVDNLDKRKSVLPISTKNAVAWADGLGIKKGGERVIYTGQMYQLLPYIMASVKNLEAFEDSPLGKLVFMGRWANKVVNVSAFMARPSREDVKSYGLIVRDIALLLRKAGVEFGYLYEDDLYTGALAYDMGADRQFEEHARRVHAMLTRRGVRSVITVDPHTHNMLHSVYPEILEGFDVEVKSYLEVLAASGMEPVRRLEEEVVVHDSCVYARYEGIIEEPRALLAKAGYVIKEPRDTKVLTHCCGGPAESIFPKTAHRIAKKRVEQLRDAKGARWATMCPICLATLNKASARRPVVNDLSALLARAYCDVPGATAAESVADGEGSGS
jgi:Fe-S oxidoreductase